MYIDDKEKRHCLRKDKKGCKIPKCKIRGRYNYGREYFYHGFCKKHYSQYQEGIIDFRGKKIRKSMRGIKNIEELFPKRKNGKRWNKVDHVKHGLRCKICGCERHGEISHGKERFFKDFCSYHYREWYLKGFMDESGNPIITTKENTKKTKTIKKKISFKVTDYMIKKIKNVYNNLVDFD